jgi:hypothetical protein
MTVLKYMSNSFRILNSDGQLLRQLQISLVYSDKNPLRVASSTVHIPNSTLSPEVQVSDLGNI